MYVLVLVLLATSATGFKNGPWTPKRNGYFDPDGFSVLGEETSNKAEQPTKVNNRDSNLEKRINEANIDIEQRIRDLENYENMVEVDNIKGNGIEDEAFDGSGSFDEKPLLASKGLSIEKAFGEAIGDIEKILYIDVGTKHLGGILDRIKEAFVNEPALRPFQLTLENTLKRMNEGKDGGESASKLLRMLEDPNSEVRRTLTVSVFAAFTTFDHEAVGKITQACLKIYHIISKLISDTDSWNLTEYFSDPDMIKEFLGVILKDRSVSGYTQWIGKLRFSSWLDSVPAAITKEAVEALDNFLKYKLYAEDRCKIYKILTGAAEIDQGLQVYVKQLHFHCKH